MSETQDKKKYVNGSRQAYHRKRYRIPEIRERMREISRKYYHSDASEQSRQRHEYIDQRDIYIKKLELVSKKIGYEKRRNSRIPTMIRTDKIKSLEQRQVHIIFQIEEYSKEIKMLSRGMTKNKNNDNQTPIKDYDNKM